MWSSWGKGAKADMKFVKSLHDWIFRPKLLHTKVAWIVTIVANDMHKLTKYMSKFHFSMKISTIGRDGRDKFQVWAKVTSNFPAFVLDSVSYYLLVKK